MAWPLRFVLFLVCAVLQASAGAQLQDGTYTIQVANQDDAQGCNDMYLAYRPDRASIRPFLMSSTAKRPMKWELRSLGRDRYTLATADRPQNISAKLSYSPGCGSTSVLVRNADRRSWLLVAVDVERGLYRIVTGNKDCAKPVLGRLAPRAAGSDGGSCSKDRDLSLKPVSRATFGLIWKLTWEGEGIPISNPTEDTITTTPSPIPIVEVKAPGLAVTLGFTGFTVETFGEQERAATCESLIAGSSYPRDKLSCTIDDVRPLGSSKRRLLQSGVEVDATLQFQVEYATELEEAEQAASELEEVLEDPVAGPQLFDGLSEDAEDVVIKGSETVTETVEVPVQPPPTPEPTSTVDPEATATPVPSPTSTPTSTPTVTPTPTPTPTSTGTAAPNETDIPAPTDDPIETIPPTQTPPPFYGGTDPPITVTDAPEPVEAAYPTVPCGDMVEVSWQAPAVGYVETYSVECVPDSGSPVRLPEVSNSLSSVEVGPLVPGREYRCSVAATNAAGTSQPGQSSAFRTGSCPSAPSDLVTINSTSVSWTGSWIDAAVAGIETEEYVLKCFTDDADCQTEEASASTSAARGDQMATINGLNPSTLYNCYVIAANNFGSECSARVQIVTQATEPVPQQAISTIYIGPDGDDSNPGTQVSPVATYSKAQELVAGARGGESTEFYRIVFLPGTYSITQKIDITESNLEITSESVSSTDTTILELAGLSIGVSISSTTSNIYLHHLTLKQMDFTGVGVLISTSRTPGWGNQIVTDWSKNIYIYQNTIELFKYGIGLAGSDIHILNNKFLRKSGSTQKLTVVLGYFMRGENVINGNSFYDDIANEDVQFTLVYITASGSSTYFDLWNSRGGTLTVNGNSIETASPNRQVRVFLQDTFNQYQQLPQINDPQLYSLDTKLSLEVNMNIVTIPPRAEDDRFKLVIFYTNSDASASMYSDITIQGNRGSVPIVAAGAGWWYCDWYPTAPETCTAFESIISMENNVDINSA